MSGRALPMAIGSKPRAGDWVEVRSKAEILETLDERAEVDGLPFMPEMLQFCGQRFRVYSRAHKTCDTVDQTGGRRLTDSVHLEGLRCDGSDHGGCDAGCLLFWKHAWLRPVSQRPTAEGDRPADPAADVVTTHASASADIRQAEELLRARTRHESSPGDSETVYSCQATQLPAATTPLPWWDVRQYVEDVTSGNVGLFRVFAGFTYMVYSKLMHVGPGLGRPLRWIYDRFQALTGGSPYPRRWGTIPKGQPTPSVDLDLQPGEWVRVKSFPEILSTLDVSNKCRGLFFDAEEVPHCGRTFRVLKRVERIINEKTGRMIHFKTGAVILDGSFCESRYSEGRLFCPRAIYGFWREIWLERVDPESIGGEPGSDPRQASLP